MLLTVSLDWSTPTLNWPPTNTICKRHATKYKSKLHTCISHTTLGTICNVPSVICICSTHVPSELRYSSMYRPTVQYTVHHTFIFPCAFWITLQFNAPSYSSIYRPPYIYIPTCLLNYATVQCTVLQFNILSTIHLYSHMPSELRYSSMHRPTVQYTVHHTFIFPRAFWITLNVPSAISLRSHVIPSELR